MAKCWKVVRLKNKNKRKEKTSEENTGMPSKKDCSALAVILAPQNDATTSKEKKYAHDLN